MRRWRYASGWLLLDVLACCPVQCILSLYVKGGFNLGYLIGCALQPSPLLLQGLLRSGACLSAPASHPEVHVLHQSLRLVLQVSSFRPSPFPSSRRWPLPAPNPVTLVLFHSSQWRRLSMASTPPHLVVRALLRVSNPFCVPRKAMVHSLHGLNAYLPCWAPCLGFLTLSNGILYH